MCDVSQNFFFVNGTLDLEEGLGMVLDAKCLIVLKLESFLKKSALVTICPTRGVSSDRPGAGSDKVKM